MKSKHLRLCLLVALLLVILLAPAAKAAASGGGAYSLPWITYAGGGGTSNSASYELNATAGIPEAGPFAGTTLSLYGGYWVEFWQNAFLPLLFR